MSGHLKMQYNISFTIFKFYVMHFYTIYWYIVMLNIDLREEISIKSSMES